MNVTLVKALVLLVPAALLLARSVGLFLRSASLGRLLQLLGAVCLVIVILTHVAEALRWFSSLRWGDERSVGYYVDLSSAILGIILFPLGHLIEKRSRGVRLPNGVPIC